MSALSSSKSARLARSRGSMFLLVLPRMVVVPVSSTRLYETSGSRASPSASIQY